MDTEIGDPGMLVRAGAGAGGGGPGGGAYWPAGGLGMLARPKSAEGRSKVGERVAPPLRFPAEVALCNSPRTSSRSGRPSVLGLPRVETSSRAFQVSSRIVSTPGRRLFNAETACVSGETPTLR